MITKETAVEAAERILAIERDRLAELQDAQARPVPHTLRVEGLNELAPRHQAALLRKAERQVRQDVHARIWVMAWLFAVGMAWWLAQSGQEPIVMILALAPAAGALAIRRWFLRRKIRELLSWPTKRQRGNT